MEVERQAQHDEGEMGDDTSRGKKKGTRACSGGEKAVSHCGIAERLAGTWGKISLKDKLVAQRKVDANKSGKRKSI